ncbi:conserved hypothetical protein [gamma proteobacterium HdN1]|nr:conserved hypothetical protein [gamma proteobacterium HdN1]
MTFALWSILIAWLIAMISGTYAKASKDFDNNNPREYFSHLEGKRARAVAAMANGFEGFPLFASAVIIAHMINGPQTAVNLLALGYLISRIVFAALYIAGKGTQRSAVWIIGFACIIGIFIAAA